MKFIILITLFVSTIHLPAATDLIVAEFLKTKPEQVSSFLDSPSADGIRGVLISASIEARRLDLIEICFRNEPGLTMEVLGEIQDLGFLDQAVIRILKADVSLWWMPEDPLADYSGPGSAAYMREPIVNVLRRYLPDVPLDGKAVINRANRLKLAADLEVAMGRTSPPETPQKERPENRMEAPAPASASTPQNRGMAGDYESAQEQSAPQLEFRRLLVWGAMILGQWKVSGSPLQRTGLVSMRLAFQQSREFCDLFLGRGETGHQPEQNLIVADGFDEIAR